MAAYIFCNGEILDYEEFTSKYGKPNFKAFKSNEVGELVDTIQTDEEKLIEDLYDYSAE